MFLFVRPIDGAVGYPVHALDLSDTRIRDSACLYQLAKYARALLQGEKQRLIEKRRHLPNCTQNRLIRVN